MSQPSGRRKTQVIFDVSVPASARKGISNPVIGPSPPAPPPASSAPPVKGEDGKKQQERAPRNQATSTTILKQKTPAAFLSDDEFHFVFGTERPNYCALPKWKQMELLEQASSKLAQLKKPRPKAEAQHVAKKTRPEQQIRTTDEFFNSVAKLEVIVCANGMDKPMAVDLMMSVGDFKKAIASSVLNVSNSSNLKLELGDCADPLDDDPIGQFNIHNGSKIFVRTSMA